MPVEINDIPLIFIYVFIFALLLVCFIFIVSKISSRFHKKNNSTTITKDNYFLIKIKTIGEYFDQIYLTSVVLVFLLVLSTLLLLPLHAFSEDFTLKDNWPFILIVLTIFFSLLSFIDWIEIKSKRTIQRDMRKF